MSDAQAGWRVQQCEPRNRHARLRTRAFGAPTIPVVDLHSDALLWCRSLLDRNEIGQVDLPRCWKVAWPCRCLAWSLRRRWHQLLANPDVVDSIGLLARSDGWPEPRSPVRSSARVIRRGKLQDAAHHSKGTLTVITTRAAGNHFKPGCGYHHTAGIWRWKADIPSRAMWKISSRSLMRAFA